MIDVVESDQHYFRISKKLHSLRQRQKRIALLSGVFLVLATGCTIVFLLLLLESYFWLKPVWKSSIFIIACVFWVAALLWFVSIPLFSLLFRRKYPNDETLAEKVGQVFPKIKDRLANAIQVYRSRNQEAERTSTLLAEAALNRLWFDIDPLDFQRIVSKHKLYFSIRVLVLIFILSMVCTAAYYRPMMDAWNRLCRIDQAFSKPIPYSLRFKPGSIRVVQEDSVIISVEGTGKMPKEIFLMIKEKKEERKIRMRPPYFYRIASVQNPLEYRFLFEKYRSDKFVIDVLERPEIRVLQAVVHPPRYARRPIQKIEPNVGHIDALKSSTVEILIKSNKEIAKAHLVFQSGSDICMNTDGKEASGHFTVIQDDQYWLEVTDKSKISNLHPIRHSIRIIPDLYPTVKIVQPEPMSDLDESMTVPLVLEAEDDFGISELEIGYVISASPSVNTAAPDTSYFTLPLPAKNPVHAYLFHQWDIKSLDLFPEDIVTYFLDAMDNDAVSGPKRGRSETHAVRFPSIGEILQKIETEQNHQITTLDSIYKKNKEFKQELDRFSDEMKTNPSLSWERKKDLQNRLEEQKDNQQEIEDLTERFNELLEQSKANNRITQETVEKYQQLQKLYQEIASPQMAEAMKKFQEALNQIDPGMLDKATEKYQICQEDLLKAIERTISLLRRIQVEQKIEEMVERMREMVQVQKDINNILKTNNFNLKKTAHQEGQLQQEAEAFERDVKMLSEKIEDLQTVPQSQFDTFRNALKRQNVPGKMECIHDFIQKGLIEEAAQQGEEASQSMADLQKMLEDVMSQLQNQQKNKVLASLKRASLQLLQLSQEQETVMQDVKDGKLSNIQAVREQMALESGLQQVADSLFKLSQETFSVSAGMGKSIGEAKEQMEQSIEMFRNGNAPGAHQRQGRSMGALNQAVLEVQNAMGKLAGSKSGLGMEEFFLQMEQMGQAQMALNRKMMDMLQQGRLSLEAQAGMAKLAAEQEAIKKQLEELLKRVNPKSKIPGNLDQTVEEMKKTVQELKQNGANQETVQRQERILSRLLDSQRSLREQDYGQKRKAKAGRNVIRRSPESLMSKTNKTEDWLRQSLLEASEDGYAPDYQEWIRSYFERLVREQEK